jgi:hypothetical protein
MRNLAHIKFLNTSKISATNSDFLLGVQNNKINYGSSF